MIRPLSQCPYCSSGELGLDDHPQLVFQPGGTPCPHLAWVDGRYSQHERTKHGTQRTIGSTEFHWDSAGLDAEAAAALLPYLQELLQAGSTWTFAPPLPFAVQPMTAEGSEPAGKSGAQQKWDVDGFAIFAQDPAAFWSALPDCQKRHLASMRVGEG